MDAVANAARQEADGTVADAQAVFRSPRSRPVAEVIAQVNPVPGESLIWNDLVKLACVVRSLHPSYFQEHSGVLRASSRQSRASVGDGGALSGGDLFAKIEPGYCDGMTVDEDGNIWSSAADGVHCLSPEGDLLGKVLVPHRVANLKFGGLHRNRLFIAGSQTLYAIFLNRRGLPFP